MAKFKIQKDLSDAEMMKRWNILKKVKVLFPFK